MCHTDGILIWNTVWIIIKNNKMGKEIAMKIEIVSLPFPPGTPQIILENQSRLMNEAKFVPAILRKVARKYQNLLLQNELFKGKLLNLTVAIHPGDYAHGNHSNGTYCVEEQGGRLHAIIDIQQRI